MNAAADFERLMAQVEAGERLPADALAALAAAPDILSVGMLADAARRRLRGGEATYLRVAWLDAGETAVPEAAREVRIATACATLGDALEAVAAARAAAGDRVVAGFDAADVARWAAGDGSRMTEVLARLRGAGLDALARVALDGEGGAEAAVGALAEAGFGQLRAGIDRASDLDRFLELAALQDRFGCIQVVDPLPARPDATRPTTGYRDVRAVALARLAAPHVPMVQVSWRRYGPKLAQVALTFGADDLDAVEAAETAPDGRRRAPLEEVRRNIAAAGLAAVERDGRFAVVG